MKKIFICLIFSLAITTISFAQEGFALKAGINNVTIKVDAGDFGSASESELGFYVGGGYNFEVSDQFAIEPSALISFVKDLTSLYVPVMLKYEVAESFSIQAGPQINYLLEDVEEGAFGLDLALGAGYQFNDNLFVEARYGFQLSRGGILGDFTKFNTLTFGAGYRFN